MTDSLHIPQGASHSIGMTPDPVFGPPRHGSVPVQYRRDPNTGERVAYTPSLRPTQVLDAVNSSTDVLGSAVTPTGSPVARGYLLPTDMVRVGNMQVPLAVAESQGYVQKNLQTGGYDWGPGPQTKAQEERLMPDVQVERLPDAQAEEFLSTVTQHVLASEQLSAVNDVVESGEISERSLMKIADRLNMAPEMVSDRVYGAIQAFQSQAEKAVLSVGVDSAEAFFEWARGNHGEAFKRAMFDQATKGTTEGYRKLASKYVQAMPGGYRDAVLGADLGEGVSVRKYQDKALVKIGNMEMEYAVAVRAGLIKPQGRR